MSLSFGETPLYSQHISQNTCGISRRGSGPNSDKGAMQRAEESLGPPFSALQRNAREEGPGGTFAPSHCTSREICQGPDLMKNFSSQDRQKTKVDFNSDLKNSTAWTLPWASS